MRTALLEELKEKPLLRLLDDLGGWPILSADWNVTEPFHWVDVMAQLRLYNNDILISMWVGPDGKDSDSNIIQVIWELETPLMSRIASPHLECFVLFSWTRVTWDCPVASITSTKVLRTSCQTIPISFEAPPWHSAAKSLSSIVMSKISSHSRPSSPRYFFFRSVSKFYMANTT